MQIHPTSLPGVVTIELKKHSDDRGFFMERFSISECERLGLPLNFVQDNHSRSNPGVLRGLHFQHTPAQGKLVGAVRGRIWDVVVDIRPESPSFGKHIGVELSDTNATLIWVPAYYAHGFCVLGDEPADVIYKVTALYNGRGEGGIAWNDPDLAINWPITNPQLSDRDRMLASFKDYKAAPPTWRV
jgi:dTDP-4-dehydrorhamnose 3,5-epimerase